ncbi:MAG: amidohydrolase family protein [Thermoanaerobaculia bacterium]
MSNAGSKKPPIRTAAALAATALGLALAARATPREVRSGDRLAYALTGARVIAAPGRVFDPGVVVVRGGVIEAAGADGKVAIPADARVFDLKGKTVYPAFIDPYVATDRLGGRRPRQPQDEEEPAGAAPGGGGGQAGGTARAPSGPGAHPISTVRAEERAIDTLTVPERVAESYRRTGFAVVVAAPQAGILRGRGAVVSLADGPMGGRILLDEYGQFVTLEPERFDFATFGRANVVYPMSRMGAVALVRQAFLDALWWRDASAAYAKHPSGQARPRAVTADAALVAAAEGRETVVFEATDVLSLLRAARIAKEFKLKARYIGAGDEYRLGDEVAALKPDLVLRVDFPKPERLESDDEWIDVPFDRLLRIDRAASNPKWMKDAGLAFSLTTFGLDDPEDFGRRVREALARGLSKDDALAAVTTVPARQIGLEGSLGTLDAGKIANLVVSTGEPFDQKAKIAEIWIDGKRYEVPERRFPAGAAGAAARAAAAERTPEPDVRPRPERDGGPVLSPKAVVVRGATIWTQGPAGILEGADLLTVDGKVVAVGRNLTAPAGAIEVDGSGKHVTPGIIDAHSHTGGDGQINEVASNVTAEVRIRDILNPFAESIYRELAGGTTVAIVLHGSANAIGGQTQIVKFRRGGGPDTMVFAGAPEGIKFALGENPKQSNVPTAPGRPLRYPQTRMGVANLIRERFLAARDYRKRQEEYRKLAAVKGALPVPPARDLQLEAIAEILEGKRVIHCHSYVKGEVLEVLRVAEEFGVKIATLQHILEGYKVADEIAKHGAGASTFSDWWAYKFEVYDAIPYNGALMRERGVVVSFNSDSDELARRLNFEAAKAVHYGGVPREAALAFVTSNPARQLGIEKRVGSLEAGKDADFVVWSGDPLATSSVALETWIEGKKEFDRAADLMLRPAHEKERADLIAKAKKMIEPARPAGPPRTDEKPPADRARPAEAPARPTV